MLTRVLYGGRVSFPVAAVVVVLASLFGTLYGALSGFLGEWFDEVGDADRGHGALVPGADSGHGDRRRAGAEHSEFDAGHVDGLVAPLCTRRQRRGDGAQRARLRPSGPLARNANRRILLRHVLPNALAPSLVLVAMDFGNAIIITAALSFLGLGAVPPTPEWGAMVSEGRELIQQWWISTFPGLAILAVSIACNFIGDGLRDAMDPRINLR